MNKIRISKRDRIRELKEKLEDLSYQSETALTAKQSVKILCKLAYELYRSDPMQAGVYAEQALACARKYGLKKEIAESYTVSGTLAWMKAKHSEALECYTKSLDIFEDIGYRKGIASCCSNIGNIHRNLCDYEEALALHIKALKIKEEIGDKIGIAKSYNNIGIIYDEWKEYDNALEFYYKALRLFEELGDMQGIAFSYNNIGVIFEIQGDFDRAVEEYKKSLGIKEEIGDKKGIASSYLNIGTLYEKLEDYENAMDFCLKALGIFEEIGDKKGVADSDNEIGNLLARCGEYDKALDYLQNGLELAQLIGIKNCESVSYEYFSKLYQAKDNFRQALSCYRKYCDLKEEIFNERNAERIAQMQVRYESEKRKREADIYRGIFENTLIGIYRITPDGKFLMVNQVMADMLGFSSPDELIQHSIENGLNDSRNTMLTFNEQSMQEETVAGLDSVWIRHDDTPLYIRRNSKAIRDISGNIVCYEGTVQDISKLKMAEKEREELLHNLGERMKEIKCLYGLSKLAEDPDTEISSILSGLTDLIPLSWEYSEYTCARIVFDDYEFNSADFKETRWKQEAHISIDGKERGIIQVFYTKEFPAAYEGPFLMEERNLINELADRLGTIFLHKESSRQLISERQRLSYILEGTNAGTWEWDISTGEIIINDRLAEILGYRLEEITPLSVEVWEKYVHPDDIEISKNLLSRHFSGELDYYECEVCLHHKNNNWVWVKSRGKVIQRADDDTPLLMAGTHQDITLHKLSEVKIQHYATHDALTELPSLRLAKDRLLMVLEMSLRNNTLAAVMFIDLDDFKQVNDTFGHEAGDFLLRNVARRLVASVRKVDTVARIGGDEFLLVLSELHSKGDAVIIAENIVDVVAQPVLWNEQEMFTGASVGIAIYPDHGNNADILIKEADKAMYVVKNSSKNGYIFADSAKAVD